MCFQSNAFQNDAFQIINVVIPSRENVGSRLSEWEFEDEESNYLSYQINYLSADHLSYLSHDSNYLSEAKTTYLSAQSQARLEDISKNKLYQDKIQYLNE